LIFYYCLADPNVASCLADLFLVVTPLYKLWKVKLPKEQRRLILGGFTAGFTTTAITLVCAGFQYAPTEWEPAKGFIRGNLTFFEVNLLTRFSLLADGFLVWHFTYRLQPSGRHHLLLFGPPSRTPTSSPFIRYYFRNLRTSWSDSHPLQHATRKYHGLDND